MQSAMRALLKDAALKLAALHEDHNKVVQLRKEIIKVV